MAVYQESFNGGIKVSGCMTFKHEKVYRTLYGPGDVVFNIHKAKKGILEKVVIKEQRLSSRMSNLFNVVYFDTLNSVWNEWDLITHSTAKQLAEQYLEDLLFELDRLNKC